ncbi:hypothetical protein DCO57_20420 [Labrenzia sp. 011]|nr:hypothetical protein DCO57_20420 [Labrenzia sp. 011]
MPEDLSADLLGAFEAHPDLATVCGVPEKAVPQAGLTNRVYRLEAERGVFFLRLPTAGNEGLVDRQAEACNLALAAGLGLALPPLYVHPGDGILLTAALEVAERVPADLPARLGAALGRLHSSGALFAGRLDPVEVYGTQREFLTSEVELLPEVAALDRAMQALEDRAGRGEDVRLVPVHGDLSPGNCLWAEDRLWLIDWEYSALADPAWDLAYAILEHEFSQAQETAFLHAYRTGQAAGVVPGETRIEAMKVRCDAVSALWALEQVARGRDAGTFLPFARNRRERALARLRELA